MKQWAATLYGARMLVPFSYCNTPCFSHISWSQANTLSPSSPSKLTPGKELCYNNTLQEFINPYGSTAGKIAAVDNVVTQKYPKHLYFAKSFRICTLSPSLRLTHTREHLGNARMLQFYRCLKPQFLPFHANPDLPLERINRIFKINSSQFKYPIFLPFMVPDYCKMRPD